MEKSKDARNYALRLLRIRPRSEAELRRRLRQKGYTAAAVDQVVADLKRLGLLSDREFALAVAESKFRRFYAPRIVEMELRRMGVAEEVAQEVIALSFDPEGFFRAAVERARMIRAREPDPQKARKRIWDYFARRGHSADWIGRVLEALAEGEELG